ncbi:unnamed protein product [Pleuronectes platessa]|uniref:Uncharacterized protein n=1 Tax=Pleuronectes platessa TaxID=8262 RepID=A0A9N7URE5_PLEPL|nr:unnamed protein product [Pleuronectes platessa]
MEKETLRESKRTEQWKDEFPPGAPTDPSSESPLSESPASRVREASERAKKPGSIITRGRMGDTNRADVNKKGLNFQRQNVRGGRRQRRQRRHRDGETDPEDRLMEIKENGDSKAADCQTVSDPTPPPLLLLLHPTIHPSRPHLTHITAGAIIRNSSFVVESNYRNLSGKFCDLLDEPKREDLTDLCEKSYEFGLVQKKPQGFETRRKDGLVECGGADGDGGRRSEKMSSRKWKELHQIHGPGFSRLM